jgi:hypothetical protein
VGHRRVYDLQSDPQETRNLFFDRQHAEVVKQMRDALDAELRERDAAQVPFGKKWDLGLNKRRETGSTAAEFPPQLIMSTEQRAGSKE